VVDTVANKSGREEHPFFALAALVDKGIGGASRLQAFL
jgi:hypothetical protein